MSRYGKWVFGALGWAFMGQLGALFGFILGAFFDAASGSKSKYIREGQTTAGDFRLALLALLAAVMKADQKHRKVELEYIRQVFSNTFGAGYSNEMMPVLKELLDRDIEVKEICMEIRLNMDHPSRLELLNVLFSLAMSDKEFHPSEEDLLKRIAVMLGISGKDYESILSMHHQDSGWAYKVLEISPDVSDEEARKAYRRMAMKYHPDKVAHLGEEVAKTAAEKFKAVNQAWNEIKSIRKLN